MKQKKRKIWHVLVALVCIGIGLAFVFGKYEFSLSEDLIAEKIGEALPIQNNGVEITDVVVDLSSESNTVDLEASGSASRLGRTYEFTLTAVGVPEYQFTSGEFYFSPDGVRIVRLEQTGGETVNETVSGLADRVRGLFPERTEQVDELQYAAEQLAPEIQAWLEGKAEIAAVYVLSRAPIYQLPNDTTGYAAQAVLDDVWVENDTLVVSLSLYRLGIWVILFFLAGILALGSMFIPFGLAGQSRL